MHEFSAASRQDFDMFFGPRVFKNEPKIVALFMNRFSFSINKHLSKQFLFDPEDYSNAAFFSSSSSVKKKGTTVKFIS